MRDLVQGWDGEAVVVRHDAPTGSWAFIALHDSRLGSPVGGCRMHSYPTPEDGLRDAMRLAAGMTYKWAAIDFPFGGGKSVLAVPPGLDRDARRGLLLRFGRLLRTLKGTYMTGVDLGTTPDDMRIVASEAPYVLGQTPSGESRDPGPYTAAGVFAGLRVALRHAVGDDDLAGRTVLVQGVGDVGEPLARLVARAGGSVLIADVDEERARDLAATLGGTAVPAGDAYDAECDAFAPCAVGAVLNPDTIPRLRCRVVAGSANNQLASDSDAELLHERAILYAPDYIVNAGGAIAFGLMHEGIEDDERILPAVHRIGESLDEIFAEAVGAGRSPAVAARRRAERVLSRGPAA